MARRCRGSRGLLLCAVALLLLHAIEAASVRYIVLRYRGPYPCKYSGPAPLALDELVVRNLSGVNLAREAGAVATALNQLSATYAPAKAVDGSNITYYLSEADPGRLGSVGGGRYSALRRSDAGSMDS